MLIQDVEQSEGREGDLGTDSGFKFEQQARRWGLNPGAHGLSHLLIKL